MEIALRWNTFLHQSGVAPLRDPRTVRECWPTAQVIKLLQASEFDPGKGSAYSNEGYFLLSMIAERLSRESCADLFHHIVSGPLHLENTGSACQDPPRQC